MWIARGACGLSWVERDIDFLPYVELFRGQYLVLGERVKLKPPVFIFA